MVQPVTIHVFLDGPPETVIGKSACLSLYVFLSMEKVVLTMDGHGSCTVLGTLVFFCSVSCLRLLLSRLSTVLPIMYYHNVMP